MKKRLSAYILCLVVLMAASLTGCGSDAQSAILGKWTGDFIFDDGSGPPAPVDDAEAPTTAAPAGYMVVESEITFFDDDGSLFWSMDGDTAGGTYAIAENQLRITVEGMALLFEFEISGNKLTLQGHDGFYSITADLTKE